MLLSCKDLGCPVLVCYPGYKLGSFVRLIDSAVRLNSLGSYCTGTCALLRGLSRDWSCSCAACYLCLVRDRICVGR